jgi:hypothetical protein
MESPASASSECSFVSIHENQKEFESCNFKLENASLLSQTPSQSPLLDSSSASGTFPVFSSDVSFEQGINEESGTGKEEFISAAVNDCGDHTPVSPSFFSLGQTRSEISGCASKENQKNQVLSYPNEEQVLDQNQELDTFYLVLGSCPNMSVVRFGKEDSRMIDIRGGEDGTLFIKKATRDGINVIFESLSVQEQSKPLLVRRYQEILSLKRRAEYYAEVRQQKLRCLDTKDGHVSLQDIGL